MRPWPGARGRLALLTLPLLASLLLPTTARAWNEAPFALRVVDRATGEPVPWGTFDVSIDDLRMRSAAIDLDVTAAVLPVNHGIPLGDTHFAAITAVEQLARTDSHDGAPLRLFLGRIGQNDSSGGRFFRLAGLHNDTVIKRTQIQF